MKVYVANLATALAPTSPVLYGHSNTLLSIFNSLPSRVLSNDHKHYITVYYITLNSHFVSKPTYITYYRVLVKVPVDT